MFLQQIINVLVLGGMYSSLAVGFTLFFGTLNLINFAHGDASFMLGAFIALSAYRLCAGVTLFSNPALLILLLFSSAMLVCAGVGYLIEKVAFKPRLRTSPFSLLITSLAVGIIIRESVFLLFPNGANPQPFPNPFQGRLYHLGSAVIGTEQICLIFLPILLVFLLHLVIKHTELGRGMRAVCEDAEAASMVGIHVNRVLSATFLIGSALGAAAGVMSGINYGSIKFDMGFVAGLKGFTAALLGGLSSIYGAIAGAYLLAFIEVMAAGYIPHGSAYRNVITFSILIIVLAFRASGLIAVMVEEKA